MTNSDKNMIRYLLGELTEQERTAFEETYFTDPQTFNELSRVESDLIDSYVRRRLTPDIRHKFENVYLRDPQRRERVKVAEALLTRVDAEQIVDSPAVSWWHNLFAPLTTNRLTAGVSVAALILLVTASVWLLVQYTKARQQLQQAQAESSLREQRERELQQVIAEERSKTERLTTELNETHRTQGNSNSETSVGPTFVSFAITLPSTRDANVNSPTTIVIPRTTTEVRLQLRMNESSYSNYGVKIELASGKEIFSKMGLKPSAKSLNLTVPAVQLETGDYILTVHGRTSQSAFEEISKSLLHVEKR